jgi:hypothetical protein
MSSDDAAAALVTRRPSHGALPELGTVADLDRLPREQVPKDRVPPTTRWKRPDRGPHTVTGWRRTVPDGQQCRTI